MVNPTPHPIVIPMEDEPLHTLSRPLCDDPTCPCHGAGYPTPSEMTLDDLLAKKAQQPPPLKVVHCGSTEKAREAFERWRLQNTLGGMIVLTIGANAKDADLCISSEEKIAL